MDIYCPICGEPWDLYELHNTTLPFKLARQDFSIKGCEVFGTSHNSIPDTDTAMKSAVLFDLLGDDIDGIAAEMEDFM